MPAYDSQIAKILGPLATVASVSALGGDAAKWVSNFRANEPNRYAYGKAQGTRYWEVANYYDRVKTYYQWSIADPTATGQPSYLDKGHELALNYRDTYAPTGGVSAHWSFPMGIALHHLLTGDAASRSWVIKVADNFAIPYYVDNLDNLNGEMDNRQQARCLEAWILAYMFTGDAKYSTLLRNGLTDILKTQDAEGAYKFQNGAQAGENKPFMVGLLNDAFLFYQRAFEDDSRIIPAIQKACQYLWTRNWNASAKAFIYQEGTGAGYADPQPDLNMLIINGFAACGMSTQANDILAGSMNAWIAGDKQFNQQYVSAYYSMSKKSGAVSAYSGAPPATQPPTTEPAPQPQPPAIDVAGLKSDLDAAKAALLQATQATTAVRQAVTAGGKRMSVNVTNANNQAIAAVAAATKEVNEALQKIPT